ncbi:MAG: nicotinate (nicotinamide) nucleotide adenylyltransferase [Bordetella sp.]|nr:MAG: nicotinate (nicotinamide) nucleotide adenylyltransferase [Bordetella sp.]
MKRIGILGGSFDPVHIAHIDLAKSAKQVLSLDEVQLMPIFNSVEKKLQALPHQRVEMLRLAISKAEIEGLTLNLTEIERGGLTNTIDTVKSFSKSNKYIWLLGTDQLANFCFWKSWSEILNYVSLAAIYRPGFFFKIPDKLNNILFIKGLNIEYLYVPSISSNISSTEIRLRLALKQNTQEYLCKSVREYILINHLYISQK